MPYRATRSAHPVVIGKSDNVKYWLQRESERERASAQWPISVASQPRWGPRPAREGLGRPASGAGGNSMDSGSKGSHRHRPAVSCVHFTLVDQMSAPTSSHIDTAKKFRVTRAAHIRPVKSLHLADHCNGSFRGNVPPTVHELHHIRT